MKAEVLKIAGRANTETVLVANSGLRPSRDPLVRHVLVPQGADAADDWIVAHCVAGDIVVTADIPLAQRAVEKGAVVLNPTGRILDEAAIGMARAMRDLKQDLRESGVIAGQNPFFSAKDRQRFTDALARTLQSALRRPR